MKSEDRKYIREHAGKIPLADIARKLGIKERKVRKIAEEEKEKTKKQKDDAAPEELRKSGNALFVSLIIILGFVVYFNALKGAFLYDDAKLVKNNVYIRNTSYLGSVITRDIFAGCGGRSNFYRPIQIISYMADYAFWKLNPQGYHLTSVILHILTALAFYFLARKLFKDRLLAFLAGAFFVMHPVHTEAVSYIAGRADLLCALFATTFFICYVKSLRGEGLIWHAAGATSLLLACLSKEYSLIIIPLILVYHLSFEEKFKAAPLLPAVIIMAGYAALRIFVLHFPAPRGLIPSTFIQRLPGFFIAITEYLRLLVFPFNLHMEYGTVFFSFTHPEAIAGIALFAGSIIYAFKIKQANRLIFFSVAWFFVALLPISNLYPINAYMAEHWLYLPSFGFFLIAADIFRKLYERGRLRYAAASVIICLAIFYAALTIKQNNYWKDPMFFYQRTLRYHPDNERMQTSLGNEYIIRGNYEKAIEAYRMAVEINPKYREAYNNLGYVYSELRRNEEALQMYKKVIELDPLFPQAYNNIGIAYSDSGNVEEAIKAYKKAIELWPYYAEAYNNLGTAYSRMGRSEEAIKAYEKAISIRPDYAAAYYNMSKDYEAIGKREKAAEFLERARMIDPGIK